MKNNYRDEKWIGKKFGRLTVTSFTQVKSKNYSCVGWVVTCDCGNQRVVLPYHLVTGHTTSCGCYKGELRSQKNKTEKTTHGGRHERLYGIWHGMKQRCYDKNNKDYPKWGGRGIKICDEWKNDYASFRSWSVDNGYNDSLTIDRIDSEKGYDPSNCRWVDFHTQATNRKNIRSYVLNGEEKNLKELADEYGIQYGTLYRRIKSGWGLEDALKAP